ncbi:hypothetical protein HTG_08320 [Natrinema mahii]|nr:hypothetical protein HTG_17050 [Natrinema mahii]OAQ53473.1 hypothetical protein HTG_08320 [Natrinema mahii]
MSSTEWTSIPVHPDVRNEIREEKPAGESYTEFLQGLLTQQSADDEKTQ